MTLDEALLEDLRRLAGEVVDRQHDLEIAEAQHRHAIRRLHASGGSVREIARAIGLSHQRVSQLVKEAGGSPGRRRSRSDPLAACSFCGDRQEDVAKLIAGPNVYVCDTCIAGLPEHLDRHVALTCSFCNASGKKARIATSDLDIGFIARICEECLTLCQTILAQDGPAIAD